MSIAVGVGLSTERDSLKAVRDAIYKAKAELRSDTVDLALAFTTAEHTHASITQSIAANLGDVPVIGCSSFGLIHLSGITRHGILIALISFGPQIYFNTAYAESIHSKGPQAAGEELGEKLLYGFKNIKRDFAVAFTDGLISNTSDLITGIQEKIGISFPVVGASASDDFTFKRTAVIASNQPLSDATSAILLGGKINFGIGINHGWKPLGKPRMVTRAHSNTVHEIDGSSAVSLYENYLGFNLARLRKELKRVSTLYPLGIFLPGEQEYLLRNLIRIDDNGALVFQGDIPEGSIVRLMIGTKDSCITATRQAIEEVKRGLGTHEPNLILVFESVSRYILLGRRVREELAILKKEFGAQAQLIGIYTYGEQAPLKAISYHGKTYFHNQSIAIIGIGG